MAHVGIEIGQYPQAGEDGEIGELQAGVDVEIEGAHAGAEAALAGVGEPPAGGEAEDEAPPADERRVRMYLRSQEFLVPLPPVAAAGDEEWRRVKPNSKVEVVIADSLPVANRGHLLSSLRPMESVYVRIADPGEFPVVAGAVVPWQRNWRSWALLSALGLAVATGGVIMATNNKRLCLYLGGASVALFVSTNINSKRMDDVLGKVCACFGGADRLPGADLFGPAGAGGGGCGAPCGGGAVPM